MSESNNIISGPRIIIDDNTKQTSSEGSDVISLNMDILKDHYAPQVVVYLAPGLSGLGIDHNQKLIESLDVNTGNLDVGRAHFGVFGLPTLKDYVIKPKTNVFVSLGVTAMVTVIDKNFGSCEILSFEIIPSDRMAFSPLTMPIPSAYDASSFGNEMMVCVHNWSDEPFTIKRGTAMFDIRIAFSRNISTFVFTKNFPAPRSTAQVDWYEATCDALPTYASMYKDPEPTTETDEIEQTVEIEAEEPEPMVQEVVVETTVETEPEPEPESKAEPEPESKAEPEPVENNEDEDSDSWSVVSDSDISVSSDEDESIENSESVENPAASETKDENDSESDFDSDFDSDFSDDDE